MRRWWLVCALAALPLCGQAHAQALVSPPRCEYKGGYPWQPNGCLTSSDLNAAIAAALAPPTTLAPGLAASNLGPVGGPDLNGTWSNLQLNKPISSSALPYPGLLTIGGVARVLNSPHLWMHHMNTVGGIVMQQPDFSDLSGQISSAQIPSGLTLSAGSLGIGTASPAGLLEVQGSQDREFYISKTNNTVQTAVSQAFRLWNSSNTLVEYGRVGSHVAANTAGAEEGTVTLSSTRAGANGIAQLTCGRGGCVISDGGTFQTNVPPTDGALIKGHVVAGGGTTDCGSVYCGPSLGLTGATSGTLQLRAPAVAGSNTLTLPAGTTDFSATGGASQVVKQTTSGGPLTVGQLNCSDIGTGSSCTVCQSAQASSHTGDTTESVLATCTIPANTLTTNSQLTVTSIWAYTGSTNAKALRVRLGGPTGTIYSAAAPSITTSLSLSCLTSIFARSLASQIGTGTSCTPGVEQTGQVTSSLDNSSSINLVLTGELASAGDSIRLDGYSVTVRR